MLLRDPFLLKFAFFGFGDKDRAVEIIDEQIALYEKQLIQRQKTGSAGNGRRIRPASCRAWHSAERDVPHVLRHAREEIVKSKEEVAAGT
jgi:hypothetical protein